MSESNADEAIEDERVMLVIGESGAGKSTLCNVLIGENHDSKQFPVSAKSKSRTQETRIKRPAFFMGDENKKFVIIDTQGFNDPGAPGTKDSHKNTEIISELMIKLTTVEHINLFVICHNSINARLHASMKYMLCLFEDIFGNKMQSGEPIKDATVFWSRCVIVYTNMHMDDESMERRHQTHQGLSDYDVAEENIEHLREQLQINPDAGQLEYVFIDSLYKKSDSEQKKKFERGCNKLYGHLSDRSPAMTEDIQKALYKHKYALAKKWGVSANMMAMFE